MYVENVKIKNFRNLKEQEVSLCENINIFSGLNASGKTSFLEAIYLSAIGRSFKTHYDKEIIEFSKNDLYINTVVNRNGVLNKISINISKNKNKSIILNGMPLKKLGDLLGTIYIVSFTPEDLGLIKQGPSIRRHFIDMELCQISNIYYYELKQYNQILRQRNALLKKIKENSTLIDTMFIWDEKLILHGNNIIKFREEFIKKISDIANEIHSSLTNNKEHLKIVYKNNVSSVNFEKKLTASLKKDIIFGSTSVGVHKDDIEFYINDKEVKSFASQGQQRTVSLSTKLAEIKLIELEKNEKPVLLLDDVLSELDKNRQEYLLNNILELQTIITCTGVEDLINGLNNINYGNIKVFSVDSGIISE